MSADALLAEAVEAHGGRRVRQPPRRSPRTCSAAAGRSRMRFQRGAFEGCHRHGLDERAAHGSVALSGSGPARCVRPRRGPDRVRRRRGAGGASEPPAGVPVVSPQHLVGRPRPALLRRLRAVGLSQRAVHVPARRLPDRGDRAVARGRRALARAPRALPGRRACALARAALLLRRPRAAPSQRLHGRGVRLLGEGDALLLGPRALRRRRGPHATPRDGAAAATASRSAVLRS